MINALRHRLGFRSVTLVVFETLLIISAVELAAYARLGNLAWTLEPPGQTLLKIAIVAATAQLCLYYADLYDLRLLTDRSELFIRIVQALGAASFLLAALYFWFPSLVIGRGVFVIAAALVIAFVIGWRVAFVWISGRVGPRERLLLVGTSTAALTLARELFDRRHEVGVDIVGFVDPDPGRLGAPVINPGVIGTIEDIPSIVRARGVDRVVVSLWMRAGSCRWTSCSR
jgi:FlaA1/EpsC-like NDP-sugar epimerase